MYTNSKTVSLLLIILSWSIVDKSTADESKGERTCLQENVCNNRGICHPKSVYPFHRCVCDDTYVGEKCERDICANNNCPMGQHCVKKTVNGNYEACCDCNGGRHGENCELSPCDPGSYFFSIYRRCWNEGIANVTNKDPFCQCNCRDGYTGTYCEKTVKCKKKQQDKKCDDGESVCRFVEDRNDYYCFEKVQKDYCMDETKKLHCPDYHEVCLQYTLLVDPKERFYHCKSIHNEKTYHSTGHVRAKPKSFLVTYICGSLSSIFFIISISLFVYSRRIQY